MKRLPAAAKINLALVVGPVREDGLHEIATVMQRIDLCDAVELEPAPALAVEGFREDTLVRTAASWINTETAPYAFVEGVAKKRSATSRCTITHQRVTAGSCSRLS
ncbi:MAG TPA: hypothetical protein VNB65_00040, partial [Gaiellaceae bacterium]|nr:hypothetical protein [Gaiellaceae bacterium]